MSYLWEYGMNKAQLKARKTKVENNLKNKDLLTTYEKQALKKKTDFYVDDRRRIS